MIWLRGAWALARANWLWLVVLLAAALVLWIDRSAVRRTDTKWVGEQRVATVVAGGRKAVVEKAAGQASARAEETINADIADVRRAARAARRRVRAPGAGATGPADLPDAATAAGGVDDRAGGELVIVEDRYAALNLKLIDVAEEGDVYRVQVIGWQRFWRDVEAAWALAEAVTDKPPD